MADELQTDLIVRAIAEGFEKLSSEMDKPGSAAERTTKKISNMDKAMKAASKAVNQMKMAAGGAKIALAFVEQAFTFAAAEAEKLGRVDVATNINEAQNALSGLADVLVQIPIGGRDFLQWMGDGAAGLANFAKMVGALGIQAQLTFGIIDQETAIQQINALVTNEAAQASQNDAAAKLALKDATEQAAEATAILNRKVSDLNAMVAGAVGKELEDFTVKQKEIRDEAVKLVDQIDILQREEHLTDEQRAELDEMKQKYIDLNTVYAENAKEHEDASRKIIFNLIEQRLAVDGFSQAEYELLTRIGEGMGIFDSATASAMRNIDSALAGFNDGNVNETNDKLARIFGYPSERTYTINTVYNESGEFTGGERRQHGGAFRAGGAYFINESAVTRPEVVQVERGGGGQVLTRQQAAGNAGNTLSIGNVNLNNGMDLAAFKAMLRQSYSG